MRGKKAKQIRKLAATSNYPENSGYDRFGTFWATPTRRIYRKMKRDHGN